MKRRILAILLLAACLLTLLPGDGDGRPGDGDPLEGRQADRPDI